MGNPKKKKKTGKGIQRRRSDYDSVLTGVMELLDTARRASARVVNSVMTATYWEAGRRIVEHEQAGQKRAEYGEELIQRLSLDLTRKYGRGFGVVQVAVMRQFFLEFPDAGIFQPVIEKSSGEADVGPPTQIFQSLVEKSSAGASPSTGQSKMAQFTRRSSAKFACVLERLSQIARRFPLPWTHYVRLLRVRNRLARAGA
jgi:hypothetical protein